MVAAVIMPWLPTGGNSQGRFLESIRRSFSPTGRTIPGRESRHVGQTTWRLATSSPSIIFCSRVSVGRHAAACVRKDLERGALPCCRSRTCADGLMLPMSAWQTKSRHWSAGRCLVDRLSKSGGYGKYRNRQSAGRVGRSAKAYRTPVSLITMSEARGADAVAQTAGFCLESLKMLDLQWD